MRLYYFLILKTINSRKFWNKCSGNETREHSEAGKNIFIIVKRNQKSSHLHHSPGILSLAALGDPASD